MLTRDQFFALAPAIKTDEVQVPGMGDVVRVRMLTAGERDRLELAVQGKGIRDIRARAVVASVVDADGNPMFTYADVPAISAMPAETIEPIFEAIRRINVISPGDIEELEKN